MQPTDGYYSALAARDPRFDGLFFVGVTSTGIYCRPICSAKTPKEANCRFFQRAEAAEKAGFRPCLRCRPELAPGFAPVDDGMRIAGQIAQRIGEGQLDGEGLEAVAGQFELSSRQIRRILQKELGVSPMELVLTRRLLLAKQLLTETVLPVTEVAFASGFGSLRRFNDAFASRYGMPPSALRRETGGERRAEGSAAITLQLAYRPPYDWEGLLAFLRARQLKGVEWVSGDAYHRTVRLGGNSGWVTVRHALRGNALLAEISPSLTPALPVLMARLRTLFDLDARPDVIAAKLGESPLLAGSIQARPGLRVPGAFDGFELAVRAVLGQQVTVQAATTLAGRFTERFGEPVATPFPEIARLCPAPEQVAALPVEAIAELGIIRSRAGSIIALAHEIAAGRLILDAGSPPETVIPQLTALPGIGPWTAQYIAMRALRWPDAWPKEDIALRQRLGGVSAAQAEALSEAWRPWRSYATLHLWNLPSHGV